MEPERLLIAPIIAWRIFQAARFVIQSIACNEISNGLVAQTISNSAPAVIA